MKTPFGGCCSLGKHHVFGCLPTSPVTAFLWVHTGRVDNGNDFPRTQHDARSIYLLTCPATAAPNTSVAVDVITKNNLQVTPITSYCLSPHTSSHLILPLTSYRLSPTLIPDP